MRRIFAFEGDGNVVQYEGGFTDYQVAYQRKPAQSGGGEMSGVSGNRAGSQNVSGNQGGNGGAGSASGADGAGMESGASVKSSQDGRAHQKKLKFSYKEQKEWETIEDDIAGLEEAIEALDAQIAVSATDYGKLNQLMTEKAEKEAQLEEKMDRWVYLNDLAEQIEAQKNKVLL